MLRNTSAWKSLRMSTLVCKSSPDAPIMPSPLASLGQGEVKVSASSRVSTTSPLAHQNVAASLRYIEVKLSLGQDQLAGIGVDRYRPEVITRAVPWINPDAAAGQRLFGRRQWAMGSRGQQPLLSAVNMTVGAMLHRRSYRRGGRRNPRGWRDWS